jgi:hypothetical protein
MGDGFLYSAGRGQIGNHRAHPPLAMLFQRASILVGDDDGRPFGGQQICRGSAYAVRASADESQLIRNLQVHEDWVRAKEIGAGYKVALS